MVSVVLACAVACGASGSNTTGDDAPAASPTGTTTTSKDVTPPPGATPPAATPDAGCVPSSGAWKSLVPGPGQAGFDPALAAAMAKHDRLHEAVVTHATGLAGTITITADAAARAKVEDLLGKPWAAGDVDPTDDLQQYEGLSPEDYVTQWGMSVGMYAGAELAADAFRYGVLRDRGGDCTELARARKMLEVGLDALHVVVTIPGYPGAVARAIARTDLPGDGKSPVTPIFDAQGNPSPAEKNNGTWRADNSAAKQYPTYAWVDSCSRDMLFGWTLAMAAAWEVIAQDPTFDAARRARLVADAKSVLDGLRIVRSNGKDLELWDPEGRRTFHGNLHETSVDRQYVLKNGVASLMALGEVAALVSVVNDASAKGYLQSLVGPRDLPGAIAQSMAVIALGGDSSNYSAYNMLFLTGFMAHRWVPDATVRAGLGKPLQVDLYAPLFGPKPAEWKQSLFDFVVAEASATFDPAAVARGLETLRDFPAAPYYATAVTNCDAAEIAAKTCTLNDGATVVGLKTANGDLVADRPIPMKLRPPSNFFWRSSPFLVNAAGDANTVFPGSDARIAYWLGRWVRTGP